MAGNENSGRKPLMELHPEIIDQLVSIVKSGNYIKTACDYVGIHKGTYHRYWNIGEEEAEQGISEEESIYVKFYNSLKKARAEAEIRNVSVINKASKLSWQAAAWWLERSFPDRYGRQAIDINQTVSGGIDHKVEGEVSYDEETKQLLQKLYWKERELSTGQSSDAE